MTKFLHCRPIMSIMQIQLDLYLCAAWHVRRNHSGHGLSQWEKALHNNTSSHWFSPYSEWSLVLLSKTTLDFVIHFDANQIIKIHCDKRNVSLLPFCSFIQAWCFRKFDKGKYIKTLYMLDVNMIDCFICLHIMIRKIIYIQGFSVSEW